MSVFSVFYLMSTSRLTTKIRSTQKDMIPMLPRLTTTLIVIFSLLMQLATASDRLQNATVDTNTNLATALVIPPELDNTAYVLMDFHTGQILAKKNANRPLPPASLTKMMTSYIFEQKLVNGELKEDDLINISRYAACNLRKGESCMFLNAGSTATAIDILRGIVIQSGNDASRAIAEHISGNEEAFADTMNAKAAELGLKHTHFRNATGMPAEGHVSTAHDLAILARAIIQKNSRYYPVYAEKEFTYNKIKQSNRNRLLFSDDTVDGLKTGHTNDAGYCLVASSKKDDMRLISVILGTKSEKARADQSRELLKWGFQNFKTTVVMPKHHFVRKERIWYGEPKNVNLGMANDFVVLMPQKEFRKLETKTQIKPNLEAPLAKGTVVGEITAYLGDQKVASTPIQIMENVTTAGFFSRTWDSVSLFFRSLWKDIVG